MSATKPLCLYYPTTVVIVDDNRTFLNNVVDNLTGNMRYKLFSSPKKALQFLQGQRKKIVTPKAFLAAWIIL